MVYRHISPPLVLIRRFASCRVHRRSLKMVCDTGLEPVNVQELVWLDDFLSRTNHGYHSVVYLTYKPIAYIISLGVTDRT